ncbi:MAG: hypothetical protein E7651_07775 [Ruminococcaceae bacterium]|nr:hypothetical protein [Oscillospiraceae bacterium]
MKKLCKFLALTLSLAITALCLVSCGKPATPEEIFEKLEKADSWRIVTDIDMELPDGDEYEGWSMDTKTAMEKQGNLYCVTADVSLTGETETITFYFEQDGDKLFVYSNLSGEWEKQDASEANFGSIGEDLDVEVFRSIFDSKLYDPYDEATRRYTMKKDSTLELDGATYVEGYLELKEDGSYVFSARAENKADGLSFAGTATLTFEGLNKTTVTLPEVGE